MTATSATAGMSGQHRLDLAGYTFSPPVMIMSVSRLTMVR